MIPFKRDKKFVGREDVMGDIEKRKEQTAGDEHSRIALVGLAGVG